MGDYDIAMDDYDIDELRRIIRDGCGRDVKVIYLESTESTNTWACEYVRRCADGGECREPTEPVLVVANSQTAGKGRLGHTWVAQPGEGISMSLIFHPHMDMRRVPQITLAAGIAVRRALRSVAGIEALVKWPNDILVRLDQNDGGETAIDEEETRGLAYKKRGCQRTENLKTEDDGAESKESREIKPEYRKQEYRKQEYRKLCGILCVMAQDMVVCGIGINVHNRDFPPEIATKAASVDICSGTSVSRTKLAGEVIARLLEVLDVLRDEGWRALKDEYDSCCVNRDGRILLTDHVNPAGKRTGTAHGTDDEGRLRVVWDDGSAEILDAGEIVMLY